MTKSIDPLLNPKSIAIFGASSNLDKISGRPLRYLKDFSYEGEIYPINPKYQEIAGIKCYPSLESIGKPVDLAIVGVPAISVLEIMEQCIKYGVKSVVIFSSGFAEIGEKGEKRQQELKALIDKADIRVCGPNSIGFTNLIQKVTATFSSLIDRVKEDIPGNLGFITQSGAFGVIIYALARENGGFFRYFINTGNEVDVDLADCLQYMAEDEKIKVIGGYCEGIRDGEKFIRAADAARVAGKSIVILKVGQSVVGAKAASKHTGSIVGSDKVYNAIFKQKGIIRVKDVNELLDVLTITSNNKLPASNRVGIFTISGGGGILLADVCEEQGLEVPELTGEVFEKVKNLIPEFGSAMNPVDVTAALINNHESMEDCLEVLLEYEGIDSLIIFISLFDHVAEKLVEIIGRVNEKTNKPIVVAWAAAKEGIIHKLTTLGVPAYPDAERSVKALSAINFIARSYKKKVEVLTSTLQDPARAKNAREYLTLIRSSEECILTKDQANKLLSFYNVNSQTKSLSEDLNSELIVNMSMEIDPTFGQMILIGVKDHNIESEINSLRLAPISELEAKEMIDEIKSMNISIQAKNILSANSEVLIGTLVTIVQLCSDLKEELAKLEILLSCKGTEVSLTNSSIYLNE